MKFVVLRTYLLLSRIFIVTLGTCIKNEVLQRDDNLSFICSSIPSTFLIKELKSLLKKENADESPINLLLESITFLTLNSNSRPLMPSWYKVQTPLKSLQMKDIVIHAIVKDAFNCKQFGGLETLSFFNIPIQTIKQGAFEGLSNLKSISFDYVEIYSFEKNVLQPARGLTSFTLKNCGAQNISIDNLFGTVQMDNLDFVSITNCNLSDTITEKTLLGLVHVVELRMELDSINKIGERSFDIVLKTLKYLYLGSNKLRSLPEGLFKSFKPKNFINLDENPWQCDRSLEHLRIIIRDNKNIFSNDIKCKTPWVYAGKLLAVCKPFMDIPEIKVDFLDVPTVTAASESSHVMSAAMDIPKSPNAELSFFFEPIVVKADETFKIECNPSDSTRNKTISLMKSAHQPIFSLRSQNKQFVLNTTVGSGTELFGFKHGLSNGNIQLLRCFPGHQRDAKRQTQPKNPTGQSMNQLQKFAIKSNLTPNYMYRFCTVELESGFIRPWDCAPYFVSKVDSVADVWILQTDRTKMIIAFVSSGICGLIIGLIVSAFLAYAVPTMIRGTTPKRMKESSNEMNSLESGRIQGENEQCREENEEIPEESEESSEEIGENPGAQNYQ